jgi:hypothetical protein
MIDPPPAHCPGRPLPEAFRLIPRWNHGPCPRLKPRWKRLHLYEAGRTSDNGRFVRNLFQRCVEVQADRISHSEDAAGFNLNALMTVDAALALREVLADLPVRAVRPLLTGTHAP